MKLHHLKPAPGAHRKGKRVGRGIGSGKGKTAGRGTKGTYARNTLPIGFEGGQMPLQRRLPKLGGFVNRNRVEFAPVNVERLNAFETGTVVDPAALVARGLVRKRRAPVKILGRGELSTQLTVRAHAFSESARTKIEQAGGQAEVI
ncbi:MAG TPA: 50S ribosomal protein L15 [Actinomycetota bacterium]|nr:50S ribosomal protein L15 [Actinomycetota bacterium]